jgi:CHAD domain-containing protein
VARPREIEEIDCDQSFALAGAMVVEIRAAEVFGHSQQVLDLDDVERLHDMRVATRRLRAALEVFRPCFPRKDFRRARKLLKALADALGERRDRDVAIGFLQGFLGDVPGGDNGRLEILIARLREEQRQANEDLAPYLAEDRLAELGDALDELVGAARR